VNLLAGQGRRQNLEWTKYTMASVFTAGAGVEAGLPSEALAWKIGRARLAVARHCKQRHTMGARSAIVRTCVPS